MGDDVIEIKMPFMEKSKECIISISKDDKALLDFLRRRNASSYAIICDSNTKKLFAENLASALEKSGLNAKIIPFPSGEKSKNLSTVEKIMDKMLANSIDRESMVVAVGGGVVGDLAGFVASAYMRGIPYVQVPTTLLAMVDSSIGGKVGVDLRKGKNCCGAFCQPEAVFMNVSYLKNLPKKEIRNGLAECIKYGIILDKELFYYIEENVGKIFSKDKDVLENIISKCAVLKAEVAIKDEKEAGLRKILNFGHTIGHAIESITGYKKYSHGEAIACGMYYEMLIAEDVCSFPHEETEKARALLEKAGFKLDLPELKNKKFVYFMKKDKKNVSGEIFFALPKKIGEMCSCNGKYACKVDERIIKKAIA